MNEELKTDALVPANPVQPAHPINPANPAPPAGPTQAVFGSYSKAYGVTDGFKNKVRQLNRREQASRLLHFYWAQTGSQRRWISYFSGIALLLMMLAQLATEFPQIYEVYVDSTLNTMLALYILAGCSMAAVVCLITYYPVWMLIHKSNARLHEGVVIALLLGGSIGSGLYLMERIFSDADSLVWTSITVLVVFFMVNTVLRGAAWGLWLSNVMEFRNSLVRIFYIFFGVLMPYVFLYPIYGVYEIYRMSTMTVSQTEIHVHLALCVVFLAMFIGMLRLGRNFRNSYVAQNSIDLEDGYARNH